MTAKTVASLLDAALPVGGTRGVAAHVADACGAAERTANGVASVENAAPASKMDSMDAANIPTPIIQIKTTITHEELLRIKKTEDLKNVGQGVGVRNVPKLIEEEASKKLGEMLKNFTYVEYDWFAKGRSLWIAGKDQDRAAIEATARAAYTGSSFEFVSAKKLVSAWNSADLFGAHSKDRTLDAYRSAQNLLIAYVGYAADKSEAAMLYELLDDRRLNKRTTIISSAYSGKELRSFYLRIGTKPEDVERLFDCLRKTVYTKAK